MNQPRLPTSTFWGFLGDADFYDAGADARVMGLWGEIEAGLYKALSPEESAGVLKLN